MSLQQKITTAYYAMASTKRRHMLVLQARGDRPVSTPPPVADEAALLDRLLEDHNRAVDGFKIACGELSAQSPEDLKTLIQDLTELDNQVAAYEPDED